MKRCNERGIALLAALLVLALLSIIILQFDADARHALKGAAGFRDQLRATALTDAGIQLARAILQDDARTDMQRDEAFDSLGDSWATPVLHRQVGDATISIRIEDERAKLNVNELAYQLDPAAKRTKIERVRQLFSLLRVDPTLVDAIMDWVDGDDVAEPGGAESAYYLTATPPYRTANSPLRAWSELLLIRGMSKEILHRLAPYITIFPIEGNGKVNMNTADPLVIQSLDANITPGLAISVAGARPFRSLQEVDRVSGFESIALRLRQAQLYDVRSSYFTAWIDVALPGHSRHTRVVLRREVSGDSMVIDVAQL